MYAIRSYYEPEQGNLPFEILQRLEVLDSGGKIELAGARSAQPEAHVVAHSAAQRAERPRRLCGGDRHEAQCQGLRIRAFDGSQQILDRRNNFV